MLPVTLTLSGGQTYPARYLYAIATLKAFRGQGIGTALLKAAHAHMRDTAEAASILVPGNRDLFTFYEKRGYKTAFFLDILSVAAGELPPLPPEGRHGDCSPEEYTRLRDLAFQGSSLYVRWDEGAVAYTAETFAQPGGFIKFSWAGGHGCAAWEETEGGVLVRELALAEGGIYSALAVLHHALQAQRYTVRLPQNTVNGSAAQPFGMIFWLIPEPRLTGGALYLSLAMD